MPGPASMPIVATSVTSSVQLCPATLADFG